MEAFMKKMSTKYLIRVSISVILLILLDQLTKIWAVVRLKDQPAISLIRGVFELQYLENRGSAFGMMQGARVFFIISTIVLFLLVCVIYIRIPKEKMYLPLRVIAVFNVADIYVTTATIALIVFILFYYKEADLERIFSKKKG